MKKSFFFCFNFQIKGEFKDDGANSDNREYSIGFGRKERKKAFRLLSLIFFQVDTAIGFLKNPKVATETIEKKRDFLQKKGQMNLVEYFPSPIDPSRIN